MLAQVGLLRRLQVRLSLIACLGQQATQVCSFSAMPPNGHNSRVPRTLALYRGAPSTPSSRPIPCCLRGTSHGVSATSGAGV